MSRRRVKPSSTRKPSQPKPAKEVKLASQTPNRKSPNYPSLNPLDDPLRPNTKRTGERSEAAFLYQASQRRFAICKPWGDSERYDFILDNRPHPDACPEHSSKRSSGPSCEQSSKQSSEQSPEPSTERSPEQSSEQSPDQNHQSISVRTRELSFDPRSPHLFRIQIKCTDCLRAGAYETRATYSIGKGRAVYTKRDIDFIAAHVVALNIWYIIPVEVCTPQPMLRFYPHRQAKKMRLEKYREAWHLLYAPANAPPPAPNLPVSLYASADPPSLSS